VNQKELYTELWKTEYIPSACAEPLARYIMARADKDEKLLDIGCGDGTTVRILRANGYNAYGVDLTLAGVDKNEELRPQLEQYFYEASVVDMKIFSDSEFDFTFSTDCLEHILPEEVGPAIAEILRITRKKTFHCMPLSGDTRLGIDVHLNRHDPEWWMRRFMQANAKGVEVLTKSREPFLKEMRHVNY
jgi:SAM-dependent methyltransferase